MRDNSLLVFRKAKPNPLETTLDVNALLPYSRPKSMRKRFLVANETFQVEE